MLTMLAAMVAPPARGRLYRHPDELKIRHAYQVVDGEPKRLRTPPSAARKRNRKRKGWR